MTQSNATIAEAYYTAMANKDIHAMGCYLHPAVEFVGPMAHFTGKEQLLEAAKKLHSLFNSLKIRAVFANNNQAMLAYDLDCPPPIGTFPAATLMTLENNLICRIELFYDARPFEMKKDEIFSNN